MMSDNPERYVVLLCPEFVGAIHGDSIRGLPSPDSTIFYRGLDRDPWWHLDDAFREGVLCNEMIDVARELASTALSWFSPGVCGDLSTARKIHAISGAHAWKDEIIRIAAGGVFEEPGPRFLGFDCYVDGFGSPLRMGIFGPVGVFPEFEDRLNAYGLFADLDELRRYVGVYCSRCEHAELEVIEPHRISETCFFQVWSVE